MRPSTPWHLPHRHPLPACLALALCAGLASDFSHARDARAQDRSWLSPLWLQQSSPTHALKSQHRLSPLGNPPPDIVVQNCDDSGPGSLRDAMAQATDLVTIDLTQLTCSTITLTTGALADSPDSGKVTLNRQRSYAYGVMGPTLTIVGNGADRVLQHNGLDEFALYGLAIVNGFAADKGGCIYSADNVDLYGSRVYGCTVHAAGGYALGGGIYAKRSADLSYSTVSGNHVFSDTGYTYGGGVFAAHALLVSTSTIAYNRAYGIGYGGGAAARGVVFVHYSSIIHNAAQYDGALGLFGGEYADLLQIRGSTISGNFAYGQVGGIEANAALQIFASTIVSNSAVSGARAGGVVLDSAFSLEIESSIIADNVAGAMTNDIGGDGTIVTGANNIVTASALILPPDTIADDPGLLPLANNGGQTLTQALPADSPAVDHGSNLGNFSHDQRNKEFNPDGSTRRTYERVVGAAADIGAFELGAGDRIFADGFDGA